MSDTVEPNFLHRLRHTPMRDLLRGNASGRLDYKHKIDATDLPQRVKTLIARIVRKTRLWRLEKVDVATELMAHFADGLAAGETAQRLVESFGDERRAARLIRRAKKRARPMTWHLFNGARWVFAMLVMFYLLLAVYFYMGQPSVKVNYTDVINRELDAYAPDQRAWPVYRQALLMMGSRVPDATQELSALLDATPQSERWLELVAWLSEHRQAIDLIHQAASKPTFGFVVGPRGSADDPELWPTHAPQSQEENPLITVQLPHLSELRTLARVLAADASAASAGGDARRFVNDINSLLSMAEQQSDDPPLVTALVMMGIRALALDQIDRVIAGNSRFLDDADLQALAHRLSGPKMAADLIGSLDVERYFFYDILQRTYTDDGSGDGRMTPEGMKFAATNLMLQPHDPIVMRMATGPASTLLLASRRELREEYDRLIDAAEARYHQPLLEADWAAFYAQVNGWEESPVTRMRFFPLLVMVPSLHRIQKNAEHILARRDGVVAGIALELYRRANGMYPASMDMLVPDLLPYVPADRIAGGPVQYRLVDGRPVIYSLGDDRDDDGGKPTTNPDGEISVHHAAQWNTDPASAPDGDWVLFPLPRAGGESTTD